MADDPQTLLTQVVAGDRAAAARLTPMVYERLRSLAGKFISDLGNGRALLQRTALVHEAYLRIIG